MFFPPQAFDSLATTRHYNWVFRRFAKRHVLILYELPSQSLLVDVRPRLTLVQLVLFLRWLYRRIRNEELMRAFVKDMATNHLPHIYNLLEKICDQQGIERRKPAPTIRWVDLNQHRRH